MNEQAAIRLMRLLIPVSEHPSTPELPIPSTTRNLCCGAHAIIAALTFAILGQKTRIARGRVCIFTREAIVPVIKHYFVVRDCDGKVFDSSVSMPMPPLETGVRFEGIGFDGSPDHPAMLIKHSRSDPKKSEMETLAGNAKKAPVLLYVEQESYLPEDMIEMKMTGVSGWIEQAFGSQFGMWPRFAWVVATELRADPPTGPCFDRDKLLQKVRATPPETIHRVKTICRKLR